MGFLALEHSKAVDRADFVLYGAAVTAFAGFLMANGPRALRPEFAAHASAGLARWTRNWPTNALIPRYHLLRQVCA